MKTFFRIGLIITIIISYSCDKENRLYYENLNEIKVIKDTSKYDYFPLPRISDLIDSSANIILSRIDTVKHYKLFLDNEYNSFRNIIETSGFNDSISLIFKDRLIIKDSSRNEIKLEVISTRNQFISSILEYMKNIERKPNYIQPIFITYSTRDSVNSFYNLDVSYPTFNKMSVTIILVSKPLQYAHNCFGTGISVRKTISKYEKTIKFKMKGFDNKLADTVEHMISF